MSVHEDDVIINAFSCVMHELKASALHNLERYCIIWVHRIKAR